MWRYREHRTKTPESFAGFVARNPISGGHASYVLVEAQGAPAQDVTVPVGQTVIVDLGNQPTGAGGEIVVRGTRNRNEVRTAAVSTNVSTAQIENLPQNDRNFLNFAALAPGVVVTMPPAPVMFSTTNSGLPGICFPMLRE